MSDCGSSVCFCCSFSSRCSVCDTYERSEAKSEREPTEREESWFSRTARRIRRVLFRVCRNCCPSSHDPPVSMSRGSALNDTYGTLLGGRRSPIWREQHTLPSKRIRKETGASEDSIRNVDHYVVISTQTHGTIPSDLERSSNSENPKPRLKKYADYEYCFPTDEVVSIYGDSDSDIDGLSSMLSLSVPRALAGPDELQTEDPDIELGVTHLGHRHPFYTGYIPLKARRDRRKNSLIRELHGQTHLSTWTHLPMKSRIKLPDYNNCMAHFKTNSADTKSDDDDDSDIYGLSSMLSLSVARALAGPDELQTEDLVEVEESVGAVNYPVTSILPTHQLHTSSSGPGGSSRGSSSVPRSSSMPSLSHMTSAGNKNPTRAASLPDMKLQSSFEEFTPDFSEDDEDDETYRFQRSCPGLYQCSVTGLVFDMEGEGEVVYRTVPWNRRLLIQHHKKPAGPLFDIKCLQQSVRQLHLPHCQIRPTAGFLAVAHVNDEGVEFITPHKITETHLVINITGFSAFGNVKDEDSPPDPVRALVLLFYKPPDDPDVTSVLNILLLPRNIVIRDVQRTRRKLIGHERFIDASPHCKLHPGQVYTLSTAPEDDLIKVQPTETEFDEESHSSYFTSIHVILKAIMRDINLNLKEKKSSCSVWERDVCLSPSRAKTLTLLPNKKLLDIRSSFIDGTSGPVVNSLLDKLLEKKVFTDSERESAYEMQNRRDKARFVIDTVRKKGDAASSEMIEFLCEVDPFLCKHLDLK